MLPQVFLLLLINRPQYLPRPLIRRHQRTPPYPALRHASRIADMPHFSGACISMMPCGDQTQLCSGSLRPVAASVRTTYCPSRTSRSHSTREKLIRHCAPSRTRLISPETQDSSAGSPSPPTSPDRHPRDDSSVPFVHRTQQPLRIPAQQRLPAIPIRLVHKKVHHRTKRIDLQLEIIGALYCPD